MDPQKVLALCREIRAARRLFTYRPEDNDDAWMAETKDARVALEEGAHRVLEVRYPYDPNRWDYPIRHYEFPPS